MKLKNRKTGEIIDIYKGTVTLHYNHGRKTIHFKHLEDLDEWEDYEEPKEVWTITMFGEVQGGNPEEDIIPVNPRLIDRLKEIGNYFETKEEAEKTVEKLKAWKRLKDKDFMFWGYSWDEGIRFTANEVTDMNYEEAKKDLDLLFGGKE